MSKKDKKVTINDPKKRDEISYRITYWLSIISSVIGLVILIIIMCLACFDKSIFKFGAGLDLEKANNFGQFIGGFVGVFWTITKDRNGNLVSAVKTVKSHFASLLATTKAEIYYDNMSRSVIIGVDESEEQTKKIIQYQNRKLAGLIDEREEKKATVFIQNCMRLVKPMQVVNKFADQIFLPAEAKMLRRLNNHYQSFVKQITILHQYQRKRDERGRLITEIEDLKIACDILFDAIMLKVDDLDSSLRQFFNRMKEYIKKQAQNKSANTLSEFQFMQRDVRLALSMSKSQCFRCMEDLELLEYVQRTGGYSNRGFKYKIVYWDDMEKTRSKIKEELNKQLAQLKMEIPSDGISIMSSGKVITLSAAVPSGSEGKERQSPHEHGD